MANKKKPNLVKKTTAKQQLKKSNLPLIVVATVVVCAAVLAVVFGNGPVDDSQPSGGGQRISAGEHLAIPVSEISSTASFFPVEVDGTEMEVLAVRASDGTIRTAFNTCQSCYTSGKGYYVQQGNDLVCQNCGYHFAPDQVEIQAGGCNPWPIFAENKTTSADTIQIPYDFLKESSAIFANWKR